MRKVLAAGVLALSVSGCQGQKTIETPFDAKSAAFIHKQGPARIDGHAFITRHDNRVMNASGQYVYLVPATPYARERFAKLYGGKKFASASGLASIANDPGYAAHTRSVKASSTGKFSFENVAAGEYYVATSVVWKDAEDAIFAKGGAIFETVSVKGKPDEVIDVVVNGL